MCIRDSHYHWFFEQFYQAPFEVCLFLVNIFFFHITAHAVNIQHCCPYSGFASTPLLGSWFKFQGSQPEQFLFSWSHFLYFLKTCLKFHQEAFTAMEENEFFLKYHEFLRYTVFSSIYHLHFSDLNNGTSNALAKWVECFQNLVNLMLFSVQNIITDSEKWLDRFSPSNSLGSGCFCMQGRAIVK